MRFEVNYRKTHFSAIASKLEIAGEECIAASGSSKHVSIDEREEVRLYEALSKVKMQKWNFGNLGELK